MQSTSGPRTLLTRPPRQSSRSRDNWSTLSAPRRGGFRGQEVRHGKERNTSRGTNTCRVCVLVWTLESRAVQLHTRQMNTCPHRNSVTHVPNSQTVQAAHGLINRSAPSHNGVRSAVKAAKCSLHTGTREQVQKDTGCVERHRTMCDSQSRDIKNEKKKEKLWISWIIVTPVKIKTHSRTTRDIRHMLLLLSFFILSKYDNLEAA